jgi:hypothetical protein
MKKTALSLILAFTTTTAFADAKEAYCYSIVTADAKYQCLAMIKNQASYCYSLSINDEKNYCLARVSKQQSYCYSIQASDLKNQCLATVR